MPPDPDAPVSGAPYVVRTTRRRGRMSEAKRTALTDLLPRWSLAQPLTEHGLVGAFGRSAPRLLDIGVGTGEATLAWAVDHPDHDVVAVELHRPGIARMVQVLDGTAQHNVRILETDVTRLLAALTSPEPEAADGSERPRFDQVRVLFPDPWPKKRHRSRRLVDRSFVSIVADLLAEGGTLHLATDWDDYAAQMMQALLDEARFTVIADATAFDATAFDPTTAGSDASGPDATGPGETGGVPRIEGPLPWASSRPDRPTTTYERRGIQAGRRVTDLLARRRAG